MFWMHKRSVQNTHQPMNQNITQIFTGTLLKKKKTIIKLKLTNIYLRFVEIYTHINTHIKL